MFIHAFLVFTPNINKKFISSTHISVFWGVKMYDRCRICGKNIDGAEDCKLVTGAENKIITYCLGCYTKLREKKK